MSKRMEDYNFHKERCKSIGVMPIDWYTFKRYIFDPAKSKEQNDLAAEELLQKISSKLNVKWRMDESDV